MMQQPRPYRYRYPNRPPPRAPRSFFGDWGFWIQIAILFIVMSMLLSRSATTTPTTPTPITPTSGSGSPGGEIPSTTGTTGSTLVSQTAEDPERRLGFLYRWFPFPDKTNLLFWASTPYDDDDDRNNTTTTGSTAVSTDTESTFWSRLWAVWDFFWNARIYRKPRPSSSPEDVANKRSPPRS
jgi:hypothetical protein